MKLSKWVLYFCLCGVMMLTSCECGCKKKKKKETPPTLTVTPGPNQPTDRTVPSGDTNVPILQFTVEANNVADLNVLSITFRASGTGDDATDVTAVKLWVDMDANGQVGGGDVQLNGSLTYGADDGTVTFMGAPLRSITAGTSEVWLLTYDFTPTADGTFTASIEDIQVETSTAGSATATGLGSPTPATVTTDPTGPQIVSAELDDANNNGLGDAGETIIVTFNSDVVVNGSDPAADFQLPVSGDTFGGGATYAAGPGSNQVTITLNGTPTITGTGVFDPTDVDPNSPSGIDVSDTMTADAIEDAYGRDAQASAPVDIFIPFKPGTGPATGLELNVLEPAGQQSGNVVIQYIAAYSDDTTNLTLTVEYFDGSAWQTATTAMGSDPTTFTASEYGVLRIFYWDSYADMPNAGANSDYDGVPLRFTLSDGPNSIADTVSVQLDNKPQAIVVPPNQVVNVGADAMIDAKRSFDPANPTGALTYNWVQVDGPIGSAATPTYLDYLVMLTPDVAGDYVFELTVSNGTVTSDAITVKLTAVEMAMLKGYLDTSGAPIYDPQNTDPIPLALEPRDFGLLPASDRGLYESQYNVFAYIDLAPTPAPEHYIFTFDPDGAGTTYPQQDITGYGIGYSSGGNDYPIWLSDVVGSENNRLIASGIDDGDGWFWILGFTVAGGIEVAGGITWIDPADPKERIYGIATMERTYTGSGGTSTTEDVVYLATNYGVGELGLINPDYDPSDPAHDFPMQFLSNTGDTNFTATRIVLDRTGLVAWVTVISPSNGVAYIPITNVGELGNYTTLTTVSGWDTDRTPTDILFNNGYLYVSYVPSSGNGGIVVIDSSTQTISFEYEIPFTDAFPYRLELLSDGTLFATDPGNNKLYIMQVDDLSAPTSISLIGDISLEGAFDVEYDNGSGRDRLLVTGSSAMKIYALQGPWEFEWVIADGSAGNPMADFKFAIDPTTGDLCMVYEQTGSGIYFDRSTDGGITWSGSPVQVTASGTNPDFAIDSQGHIIVVYDDGAGKLWITRSTDNGANWESPTEVLSEDADATYTRSNPSITLDKVDNIIVAYEVNDGTNTRIGLVKSVPHQDWLYWGYVGTGNPDNLVDGSTADATTPDVVVLDDGSSPLGKVAVVWADTRGGDSDIYSDTATDSGWLPDFAAADTVAADTAGTATAPTAAVDTNDALIDALIFAYQEDDGAGHISIRYNDATTVVDDSTGAAHTQPHIAVVDHDTIYIAYLVDDKFIYVREWNGVDWSTVYAVSLFDSAKKSPQIATNRSGSRMVGWLDERAAAGDWDIYFTRWK